MDGRQNVCPITYREDHIANRLEPRMTPLDLRAVSDAELVARFAAGRDQRAFAEVIRRHGPMVMAAARRVLRHEQDAEDAFQATFLALARACCRLRRFSPSIYNLLIFQTVMDRG